MHGLFLFHRLINFLRSVVFSAQAPQPWHERTEEYLLIASNGFFAFYGYWSPCLRCQEEYSVLYRTVGQMLGGEAGVSETGSFLRLRGDTECLREEACFLCAVALGYLALGAEGCHRAKVRVRSMSSLARRSTVRRARNLFAGLFAWAARFTSLNFHAEDDVLVLGRDIVEPEAGLVYSRLRRALAREHRLEPNFDADEALLFESTQSTLHPLYYTEVVVPAMREIQDNADSGSGRSPTPPASPDKDRELSPVLSLTADIDF